jgi:hypothetical protein
MMIFVLTDIRRGVRMMTLVLFGSGSVTLGYCEANKRAHISSVLA